MVEPKVSLYELAVTIPSQTRLRQFGASRKCLILLVAGGGIEPPTLGL